jgi:hypothetical protein
MAKAMDHSEIYRPLFDSPDPRPMYWHLCPVLAKGLYQTESHSLHVM